MRLSVANCAAFTVGAAVPIPILVAVGVVPWAAIALTLCGFVLSLVVHARGKLNKRKGE